MEAPLLPTIDGLPTCDEMSDSDGRVSQVGSLTDAVTSREPRPWPRSWLTPARVAEFAAWNRIAWPVGLSILARNLLPVMDLAFLGRFGTRYLAAASLAQIWIAVTSGWIWKSFGATLNTLAAQAHGAGHGAAAGVWLQTALLCVVPATVAAGAAFAATAPVLRAVGFDADQAGLAGQFAAVYAASLPPMHAFVLLSNFLQSRGIVGPVLCVNAGLLPLNAALNAVLVFGLPAGAWGGGWRGLGFVGSPLATSLTAAVAPVALGVWAARAGHLRAAGWRGWAPAAAAAPARVRAFLALAGPVAVGNLVEDAQLQVVAALAARLPDAGGAGAPLATHAAFMNLFLALSCLLYGAVKATTIRVGHHLGAGDVGAARLVVALDLAVSGVLAAAVGGGILAARPVLGELFSPDPEVHALAASIALPVGVGYVLISLFFVAMATLQGQGRTRVIMAAFVVGAWGVTVPMAWGVTRPGGPAWGLSGLWLSLVAGYGAITALAWAGIAASDWAAIADAAAARACKAAHAAAPPAPGSPRDGRVVIDHSSG